MNILKNLTVIMSLFTLMGCSIVILEDEFKRPIPTKNSGKSFTDNELKDAIRTACKVRGWIPKFQSDGSAIATINVRAKHYAKIKITRQADNVIIKYIESKGLKKDGDQIHKNYMRWINNLHHTITLLLSEETTETNNPI